MMVSLQSGCVIMINSWCSHLMMSTSEGFNNHPKQKNCCKYKINLNKCKYWTGTIFFCKILVTTFHGRIFSLIKRNGFNSSFSRSFATLKGDFFFQSIAQQILSSSAYISSSFLFQWYNLYIFESFKLAEKNSLKDPTNFLFHTSGSWILINENNKTAKVGISNHKRRQLKGQPQILDVRKVMEVIPQVFQIHLIFEFE